MAVKVPMFSATQTNSAVRTAVCRHEKGHCALLFVDFEMYFRFPEDDTDIEKEYVADIVEKMVSEEIEIDKHCKNPKVGVAREVFVRES
jgi:hypothetical protein